jgi:hypothetical protein
MTVDEGASSATNSQTNVANVPAAPAVPANNNQAPKPVNFNRIKIAISNPRLAPYLILAKGKLDEAVLLHQWNAEISASLLPALHFAEILVRNLALQRVINKYGKSWYDNPNFYNLLKNDLRNRLNEQVKKEKKAGRIGNLTNYTANEMTFGFWSSLYTSKFHSIFWDIPLSRIRTNIDRNLTISQLQTKIDKVKTFRNNVAHHKNLVTKQTDLNYNLTIELIGDICGVTKDKIESGSSFFDLWLSPPTPRANWGS